VNPKNYPQQKKLTGRESLSIRDRPVKTFAGLAYKICSTTPANALPVASQQQTQHAQQQKQKQDLFMGQLSIATIETH